MVRALRKRAPRLRPEAGWLRLHYQAHAPGPLLLDAERHRRTAAAVPQGVFDDPRDGAGEPRLIRRDAEPRRALRVNHDISVPDIALADVRQGGLELREGLGRLDRRADEAQVAGDLDEIRDPLANAPQRLAVFR